MTKDGRVAGAGGSASAGRVIAGTARGTRLLAPGPGTRPFSDRVKQALFAILEPHLRGGAVLDLFAGSGAGGIEALSRGAVGATFVEHDADAIAVLRENLERTHLAGPSATIIRADAIGWLERTDGPGRGPFSIVLIDPPYDRPELLAGALARLGQDGAILVPRAIVIAKHFWRDPPADRIGLLASFRTRRFGETTLTFCQVAESPEVRT